ncbi:cation:proton antiporter [Streptomyces sp. NPDC088864]|uniref:cation:proton antiporter n=1 Tax=Streptomyces sp. NPDC088864 TaxID=3365910 RepID=UPI0037FE15A5
MVTASALAHGDPTTRFLLAVLVIVVSCHAAGLLLRRLGQPPVVGDILAGLTLGPTALGALAPETWAWLFPPDVREGLEMAAQLGIVFFMFLVGCEFEVGYVKGRGRAVGVVALAGAAAPFVCGLLLAPLLYPGHGNGAPAHGFALFLGLSLSITALPVLAGILRQQNLLGTVTGSFALAVAAVADAAAWVVLAVVLSVSSGKGVAAGLLTGVLAVAFTAAVLTGGRRGLARLYARGDGPSAEHMVLAITAAAALAASLMTQLIGLHTIFGAFLLGAVMPRSVPAAERTAERLGGLTRGVLLPLFFAHVAMSAEFTGVFSSTRAVFTLLGVLVVTVGAKLAAATLASRMVGFPRRQAAELGVLLNCRGLTELVIADVGRQAGLIDNYLFTVLVVVALVTTAVTTPLLHLVRAGDKGETETRPADRAGGAVEEPAGRV